MQPANLQCFFDALRYLVLRHSAAAKAANPNGLSSPKTPMRESKNVNSAMPKPRIMGFICAFN